MDFIAAHLQNRQQSSLRKILSQAPADAINMALGEIHYPSSPYLIEQAVAILQTEPLRYTENAGFLKSREAIANYYDELIRPDNICLTAGAQEALFAVLFSILNKGDEILIADPTFLAYHSLIELLGGKVVVFPLHSKNGFSLHEKSLQKAITPKTKAILLCNPSNPLGSSFSLQEVKTVIKIAGENQLLIIADEIYRELYFDKQEKSFLSLYENTIVISGLSKSHSLSGWRIGWFAARQQELMKKIIVSHQYICTSAPTLAQKIVPYALSQKGMKYVAEIRDFLAENKKNTLRVLQNSGYQVHPSTHAPYLFFRTEYDDIEFCKELLKEGIITVPGSFFGKNGKYFVRLNYGIQADKLNKALQIIEKFIFIC